MADEYVKVDTDGGIATVTVNRPEKRNALNAEIVTQLFHTFLELDGDPAVRAVILTGAGEKAFVAGADIGELAQMTPLTGNEVSRAGQDAFRFIETMRMPVIAA